MLRDFVGGHRGHGQPAHEPPEHLHVLMICVVPGTVFQALCIGERCFDHGVQHRTHCWPAQGIACHGLAQPWRQRKGRLRQDPWAASSKKSGLHRLARVPPPYIGERREKDPSGPCRDQGWLCGGPLRLIMQSQSVQESLSTRTLHESGSHDPYDVFAGFGSLFQLQRAFEGAERVQHRVLHLSCQLGPRRCSCQALFLPAGPALFLLGASGALLEDVGIGRIPRAFERGQDVEEDGHRPQGLRSVFRYAGVVLCSLDRVTSADNRSRQT
mmetsp:Transcript_8543/g.32160  ORF Transcript_8543/g.32160 Transcript_8543/m.32160 type:complete len:270 (+) Transcript_8543:2537-3346(+)